jgi:hypothetical protein
MVRWGPGLGQEVDALAPVGASRIGPPSSVHRARGFSCYLLPVARWTRVLVGSLLGLIETAETARAAPTDDAAEEQRDPVLVRPFLQISSAEARLQADDQESDIELVPNPTSNVGIKLGAWGLAVSLSFGVGHVESAAEHGKSDNFNFELSYPFSIADHELYVTAFLHYHETLSTVGDGARQLIDGARLMTLGFDTVYLLSPKFSLDRVLGDFAPRDESSGSWFLRASTGFWLLGFTDEPDRLLIPADRRAELGEVGELNRLSTAFLTVSGGYVYDWNMFHHFFLTALGNLGLNLSAVELHFVARERDSIPAIGPAVALQLGLSYVGSTFHTGLTSNATADIANARGVDFVGQRISALIFVGLRL